MESYAETTSGERISEVCDKLSENFNPENLVSNGLTQFYRSSHEFGAMKAQDFIAAFL